MISTEYTTINNRNSRATISTNNYIFITIFFSLLSVLSSILGEPVIVVRIHTYFLFIAIILHLQLFQTQYLIRIILLALLFRISLYMHIMLGDDFVWKNSLPFFEDDSSWYIFLSGHVLETLKNGEIPNLLNIGNLGGRNGIVYSYVIGVLLYVGNFNTAISGLTFIPLFHFVLFTIMLIYLNKLVLSLTHSLKYARLAVTLMAFSPQHYFWNFLLLKDSYLTVMFLLFTYNIFKYKSEIINKNKYFLSSIIISLIMFLDRVYFGYFAFLTIFIVWVSVNKRGTFYHGLFSYKKIFFTFLLSVVFYQYIIEQLFKLKWYMTVGANMSGGLLEEIGVLNNPILGLLRQIVTPLPFRATLFHNLHEISHYSFFFQVPLIICSYYGVKKIIKWDYKNIYIFIPLFLFLIIFAFYDPGMNRIRDNFIPLLVILASLSYYQLLYQIKKIFKFWLFMYIEKVNEMKIFLFRI
jgi:hypothetical protein